MRITEQRMLQVANAQVGKARERVAKASEPLSSGIEINRPSDDPARWAAGRRAQFRNRLSEHRESAIVKSQSRLSESERVYQTIGDVVSRARELAIGGANASMDAAARQASAREVGALFSQALVAANSRGLDGEFLLAGDRGDQQPFDATGVYQGDGGQRTIEAGEGHRFVVSVNGTGLTAAGGVDVFAELSALQTALDTNDIAGIQTAIGSLDTAVRQVSVNRAEVGALQGALLDADAARTDFELALSDMHMRNVEADTVEAASELSLGAQSLEVAQAVTTKITELLRVR